MKKAILLVSIVLLVFSCGNSPEKLAQEKLDRAQELFNKQEYSSTKDILDSLKVNYPNLVKIQKARLSLAQKVDFKLAERNLSYCDSMLIVREQELPEILPMFIFEKNTDYEDLGKYIDKEYNPTFDNASQFIKVTVNELGEIALVSAYSGNATDHTYVKVSDSQGNYAETDAVALDGGLNYIFKDVNGKSYQTATFIKGRDNGVITFICEYMNEKLILERLGGKKTTPVEISTKEKESIKRLTELSVVLSDIEYLKKEIERSIQRIEYLRPIIEQENN